MVADTPPHDSDDERDDLAALDFSVTESEPAESDLDALGDYTEEPAEDGELPVPVFAVTIRRGRSRSRLFWTAASSGSTCRRR